MRKRGADTRLDRACSINSLIASPDQGRGFCAESAWHVPEVAFVRGRNRHLAPWFIKR